MALLTAEQHSAVDVATVAAFGSVPGMLHFSETPARLARAVSLIHGAVTGLSELPFGLHKSIPPAAHAWIERLVGPALVVAPWIFRFAKEDRVARNFFVAAGVAITAVRALSQTESKDWALPIGG